MKKFFVFFSAALLLYCCTHSNKVKVSVTNNSESTIDSIKIFASAGNDSRATVFSNIGHNITVRGWVNFDDDLYGDGVYIVDVYENGEIKTRGGGGYFTNGAPLQRKVVVEIRADSIITQIVPYFKLL